MKKHCATCKCSSMDKTPSMAKDKKSMAKTGAKTEKMMKSKK